MHDFEQTTPIFCSGKVLAILSHHRVVSLKPGGITLRTASISACRNPAIKFDECKLISFFFGFEYKALSKKEGEPGGISFLFDLLLLDE
jgi:hypothetical protein